MSTRIPSCSTPQCEQLSVSTVGAAPDAMGLRGNSPYPLTMEQNLPTFIYILSQRGEKQLDTKLLLKRGDAAVANTVHWFVGFVPNSVQLWVRGPRTVRSWGSSDCRRFQGVQKTARPNQIQGVTVSEGDRF